MTNPRRVEIVLDFVCVHSYLGFTRLARAARQYRADGGEVEVVFRARQLRPDASPTGEPLFDVHKRDRGRDAAREIASDTSIGVEDGLEINLGRAVFTNTFAAHQLLAQASAQGRGEQMAERLFRAYFTDGVNIADRHTLARLGAETAVMTGDDEIAELRTERVRHLGITPTPVFRFDDGHVLIGEQSEETLLDALKRQRTP